MKLCMNCNEREATCKVGGYDACERCADQAALPPYMRGGK